MSFPGNINLNNLASLMASAGGAGAYPGFNAAAMAAAAASQPAADGPLRTPKRKNRNDRNSRPTPTCADFTAHTGIDTT